jgi:hypothetical protein
MVTRFTRRILAWIESSISHEPSAHARASKSMTEPYCAVSFFGIRVPSVSYLNLAR